MGRAALIVSSGVLLSRVLGMLREILLAGLVGANASSDEYVVAFIIPDFLNYLLAGGYLAITFIPILSRRFAEDDEAGAWQAFSAIARPLAVAMTILVLVGMAIARPVIDAVTGLGPEQIDNATRLTRIILPAQLFFVIGTLLMAVQYARERFLIPTLAPIVYNLGIILGGVLLTDRAAPTAEGFAWGVLAGALVGNFGLQAYGAYRAGLRMPWRLGWRQPVLKEYLLLAVPLMLGQSLVLLDESLGRIFGSRIGQGPATELRFARQTMLVPVGVIAQAAGVAAYPFLARLAEEGKLRRMTATLTRALKYVVVLSMAAGALLVALSVPTVRLLFERGRFTAEDTVASAGALIFYALAIPLWGAQQLYARGFYARRQMWAPVVIGTIATIAAVPVYLWLGDVFGVKGLALASTLSLAAYTAVLGGVWYARTGWEALRPLLDSAVRTLPVAVGAGIAAYLAARLIGMVIDPATTLGALAALVAGGGAAAGVAVLLAANLGDVVRARRFGGSPKS